VHLAYERKGFSAFVDLGLAAYVHNARDFEVDQAVAQLADLADNPDAYFRLIEARRPALLAARDRLLADLRTRLGPCEGIRR
jgi:hypothetical protein